jgi:hypothetical protein
MRIPRRYMIPLVVFLIVRVIVWGFEIRHRRDVQRVFDTAAQNGWPVLLLYNGDDTVDYAYQLYTMIDDSYPVWLGPGLQGHMPGSFIEGGSIIGLAPSSMELLRIDPPHFSPRPIRAHPLPKDVPIEIRPTFRFHAGAEPLENYSITIESNPADRSDFTRYGISQIGFEYWLDSQHLVINDLMTGKILEENFARFPQGPMMPGPRGNMPECRFSPNRRAAVIASPRQPYGYSEFSDNFWILDLETHDVAVMETGEHVLLERVGWDGRMLLVNNADSNRSQILDAETGDILMESIDRSTRIGRRWLVEPVRAVSDRSDYYFLFDAENEFNKYILSIYSEPYDRLVSIYEP